MPYRTDDVRIQQIYELITPQALLDEFPLHEEGARLVYESRQTIHNLLYGRDLRLAVIAGPCSIHDVAAAEDYAGRLLELARQYRDALFVIMRVYFEKPRTTVGWKGLINDPFLDGSFQINEGLRRARGLLLRLTEMGVPCAT